jgi:hypothetical protein
MRFTCKCEDEIEACGEKVLTPSRGKTNTKVKVAFSLFFRLQKNSSKGQRSFP